jgi:hypothetical protein
MKRSARADPMLGERSSIHENAGASHEETDVTLSVAAAAVAASLAVAGPGYGPGGIGQRLRPTPPPPVPEPAAAWAWVGRWRGNRGGRGHGMGWARADDARRRTAHRNQMMSLKTLDECNGYLAAHHAEWRARDRQGITLPGPRVNACERMQARGRFG